MRNIWTIFKTDLRSLSRSFFACAVVVGIVLLPSLYAWLNIYSNWDPYGSTGGISIAVASLDRGYTDGGEYVNKGRDVLEDLKTATSINWVIVNTEKEATDGVCAGDYYAAVVIDEDFSRKMYRMFTDWNGRPAITYYENAKKNAVATKITDTAVETLKRSISENYLEVLIGGVMEQSNLLAADLTEDDPEAACSIIETFIEETGKNVDRMQQALDNEDTDGIAAMAHKLLPLFTLIGASETIAPLKYLESCRGEMFVDEIKQTTLTVLAMVPHIISEAKEYLSYRYPNLFSK